MTICIPRKLATTMGTELTFMPVVFENMFYGTKGKINMTTGGTSGILGAHANILDRYLRLCNVPVNNCGTDPSVVEVSTKPYSTANGIRKIIRTIRKCAMETQLTPVAEYTIGGGAHIHTGIMGDNEAERERYTKLMAVWGYVNPWMAWAFAGPKDSSNANAIVELPKRVVTDEPDITRLKCAYEENMSELKREREHLAFYEKKLHTAAVWGRTRHRESCIDEINSHRYWVRRHRLSMLEFGRLMVAWGEANMAVTTEKTVEELDLNTLAAPKHKDRFIRSTRYGDYGTIEFRCFLMQPTHTGHDKHIMLVDAICRHVYKWMKRVGDGNSILAPAVIDYYGIKYSAAKRGFNTMLQELGLDPRDFRAECVNIALRLRARRNRGYI